MGNPWNYDFSAIGQRAAPLLLILGSDSDAVARKHGSGFRVGGNSDVYQLIPETLRVDQLNLSKQFLKAEGRPNPAHYPVVLNLVTDPDQHPRTLERVRKLLRGYKGRVINRPEAILRTGRDQVAKRLAGIDGLLVPKVVRLRNPKPCAASTAAQRAFVSYPVIARQAGTHTGQILGLFDNPQALDAACVGPGEFIITEFVDFASPDGLYRKYRLWSFGRRTVLKHVIISEEWNVHNKDRYRLMPGRQDLIDEEMRLFARPEGVLPAAAHAAFEAVRGRLGLDFFGMDFGIDQAGRAILFEANATMSFAMKFDPPFTYLEQANEPARQAFSQMLNPEP